MEISCPYTGCKQGIKHDDVKRIADNKLFERYDTLMLRQTLSELPDFRWCKNSGCGSGQINFEGGNDELIFIFFLFKKFQ